MWCKSKSCSYLLAVGMGGPLAARCYYGHPADIRFGECAHILHLGAELDAHLVAILPDNLGIGQCAFLAIEQGKRVGQGTVRVNRYLHAVAALIANDAIEADREIVIEDLATFQDPLAIFRAAFRCMCHTLSPPECSAGRILL